LQNWFGNFATGKFNVLSVNKDKTDVLGFDFNFGEHGRNYSLSKTENGIVFHESTELPDGFIGDKFESETLTKSWSFLTSELDKTFYPEPRLFNAKLLTNDNIIEALEDTIGNGEIDLLNLISNSYDSYVYIKSDFHYLSKAREDALDLFDDMVTKLVSKEGEITEIDLGGLCETRVNGLQKIKTYPISKALLIQFPDKLSTDSFKKHQKLNEIKNTILNSKTTKDIVNLFFVMHREMGTDFIKKINNYSQWNEDKLKEKNNTLFFSDNIKEWLKLSGQLSFFEDMQLNQDPHVLADVLINKAISHAISSNGSPLLDWCNRKDMDIITSFIENKEIRDETKEILSNYFDLVSDCNAQGSSMTSFIHSMNKHSKEDQKLYANLLLLTSDVNHREACTKFFKWLRYQELKDDGATEHVAINLSELNQKEMKIFFKISPELLKTEVSEKHPDVIYTK